MQQWFLLTAAAFPVKDAINEIEESNGSKDFMEDPSFEIRIQIADQRKKAEPDCPYINYNPLSSDQLAEEFKRLGQLEGL